MNRHEELELIKRASNNSCTRTTTLGTTETRSPVSHYIDPERFNTEMSAIFRSLPTALLHASELPAPDTFKTLTTHLGNVVFTRDNEGKVHAFYNACRHRGAKVASADSGCAKRLTCPYHAWSYSTRGELKIISDAGGSFPNVDKSTMGLKEIHCTERYGFIWLCPQAKTPQHADQALSDHLGPEAAADLEWLDIDKLHVFERSTKRWKANWKIVSEGGLETYHFKFAHKNTIGPYFLNNSCVYDRLGNHARVTMTTENIKGIDKIPEQQRHIRDIAHIVYGVMPELTLLVQKQHIDWIRITPVSVDETDIQITTLIPKEVSALTEEQRQHWQRNMEISLTTLDEDFVLAEAIQSNMSSGANDYLTFGRNESALHHLNDWIDNLCANEQ